MNEIMPPHSKDIERAVIGAMLIDSDAITTVIEADTTGIFYYPPHEVIFKALEHLHEHSDPVDQLTVCDQLARDGVLDNVGGEPTIAGMMAEATTSANIDYHLLILKNKAALRRLQTLCLSTLAGIDRHDADPGAIVQGIDETLVEVRNSLTKKRKNITEEIRDWVLLQDGDFFVTDCYRDMNLVTQSNKIACRVALKRLVEEGIIEHHGPRRGSYCRVLNDCPSLDWRNAPTDPLDIALPLGIEEYVAIMPGNLIVLAGEPNAGKTAFLLNVTRLNMDRRQVHYFSSEGGVEEHKRRIMEFALGKDSFPVDSWKHKFYERSGDFHDVIRPADINIIDFLEMHDEFYRIGEFLKKIQTKLTTGVAFVAIQKNPGADHGIGGVRGLERARLYLAMETGKLVIRKGKVPKKRTVKPDGKTFYFRIEDGCRFLTAQ